LNIDNEGNHLPCGSSEGSPSFATPQDTFSGQHPPPNPQKKFPYVVWDGIVWRNLRSITPRCHECVVHVKRCVMTPRGCESCQNFGVHCVFLNHQGTRIWLAKNPWKFSDKSLLAVIAQETLREFSPQEENALAKLNERLALEKVEHPKTSLTQGRKDKKFGGKCDRCFKRSLKCDMPGFECTACRNSQTRCLYQWQNEGKRAFHSSSESWSWNLLFQSVDGIR